MTSDPSGVHREARLARQRRNRLVAGRWAIVIPGVAVTLSLLSDAFVKSPVVGLLLWIAIGIGFAVVLPFARPWRHKQMVARLALEVLSSD